MCCIFDTYLRVVPNVLEQKFVQNIHQRSQASLTRFSASGAAASTQSIFVLLELLLLWHYLNNVGYAFICSLLMSIWRLQASSKKQISSRTSRHINIKLTLSIVFVLPYWFSISTIFKFMPNYPKPGHLKNRFFLLFTAWISLSLPLSHLPSTCDINVVSFQRNVSRCV